MRIRNLLDMRESIRLALEEKIAKTKDIADRFDRWILILLDDSLPGMMEPKDIGALDLNLHHFNSVAILNPDASLALEYPSASSSFTGQFVSVHTSFMRNKEDNPAKICMTGSKPKVGVAHSLQTRGLFHDGAYLRSEVELTDPPEKGTLPTHFGPAKWGLSIALE